MTETDITNLLFEQYLNSTDTISTSAVKRMLLSSKGRARKSNIEFTIGIKDIKIPERCPYLGIPLTLERGNGRQKSNSSIDRIDNSRGYVKGNVQVISDLANTMKSSATIAELQAFAQGVLKTHPINEVNK